MTAVEKEPEKPTGVQSKYWSDSEFGKAPSAILDWIDGLDSEQAHRALDWMAANKILAMREVMKAFRANPGPGQSRNCAD